MKAYRYRLSYNVRSRLRRLVVRWHVGRFSDCFARSLSKTTVRERITAMDSVHYGMRPSKRRRQRIFPYRSTQHLWSWWRSRTLDVWGIHPGAEHEPIS